MRVHVQWCRQIGSRLYVALLKQVAVDVESGGPCWTVLEGREADPLESALPLRFMGAVHKLVLQGQAPALARYYPSVGGEAESDGVWTAFRDAVEEHTATLRKLVLCPVQTNEVGRCAALLGGFLSVAKRTELPLRLFEIGSSAGLNLRWDHYRYEIGGMGWGNPNSSVQIKSTLLGGQPPMNVSTRVVERGGCDTNPLDPCSAEDRFVIMSFVPADQIDRLERLSRALDLAQELPVPVARSDALEWLPARLDTLSPGAATVVFHSLVMQYLSEANRTQLRRVLETAGLRATNDAPLAWLRMEHGKDQTEVRVSFWPGGAECLLATAGNHGQHQRWLAS